MRPADSGGLGHRQALGLARQPRLGHGNEARVRARSIPVQRHAQRRPAAPHLLPNVVAVGHDDTGEVAAGDLRQRRAEQTQRVDDVERVHRGCVYLDKHLPRPGSGTGSERTANDSAGGPLAWITTASISCCSSLWDILLLLKFGTGHSLVTATS